MVLASAINTAGAVLNGGSLSRVAGENVGVYGINQGDLALNSGNYDLSYLPPLSTAPAVSPFFRPLT